MRGSPIWAATASASCKFPTIPDRGIGICIVSIILWNRSRSSARSITSGVVPRIRTPAVSSAPGRFVAHVAQGEGRVHAAIIEFDPLADPVGSAAEDHYLFPVAGRNGIRRVVGGEVVGGVFHAAYRPRLP